MQRPIVQEDEYFAVSGKPGARLCQLESLRWRKILPFCCSDGFWHFLCRKTCSTSVAALQHGVNLLGGTKDWRPTWPQCLLLDVFGCFCQFPAADFFLARKVQTVTIVTRSIWCNNCVSLRREDESLRDQLLAVCKEWPPNQLSWIARRASGVGRLNMPHTLSTLALPPDSAADKELHILTWVPWQACHYFLPFYPTTGSRQGHCDVTKTVSRALIWSQSLSHLKSVWDKRERGIMEVSKFGWMNRISWLSATERERAASNECEGERKCGRNPVFVTWHHRRTVQYTRYAHAHANFIPPTRNHCHIWQHSQTISL